MGTPAELIHVLRGNVALSDGFGVVKLLPAGFVARIVDGKGRVSTKEILMPGGSDESYVLYVKQGWETMAMCKPLDLFMQECTLGKVINQSKAIAVLEENNDRLERKIRERAAKDAAVAVEV